MNNTATFTVPEVLVQKDSLRKITLIARISLVGPQGPRGYSAYELWLQRGHTGSLQDYLDSVVDEARLKFKTHSLTSAWFELPEVPSIVEVQQAITALKAIAGDLLVYETDLSIENKTLGKVVYQWVVGEGLFPVLRNMPIPTYLTRIRSTDVRKGFRFRMDNSSGLFPHEFIVNDSGSIIELYVNPSLDYGVLTEALVPIENRLNNEFSATITEEIAAAETRLQEAAANIDDDSISTTTTWSSDKIFAYVANSETNILGFVDSNTSDIAALTATVVALDTSTTNSLTTLDTDLRTVIIEGDTANSNLITANSDRITGAEEAIQALQTGDTGFNPPSNVNLTNDDVVVILSWNAVTGATGYTVQRKLNNGNWEDFIVNTQLLEVSDNTLGELEFKVQALKQVGGISEASNFSGSISTTLSLPTFSVNLQQTTDVNIIVTTTNGTPITFNPGDGSADSIIASGVTYGFTYPTAFTGEFSFVLESGVKIKEIALLSGNFSVTDTFVLAINESDALTHFTYLSPQTVADIDIVNFTSINLEQMQFRPASSGPKVIGNLTNLINSKSKLNRIFITNAEGVELNLNQLSSTTLAFLYLPDTGNLVTGGIENSTLPNLYYYLDFAGVLRSEASFDAEALSINLPALETLYLRNQTNTGNIINILNTSDFRIIYLYSLNTNSFTIVGDIDPLTQILPKVSITVYSQLTSQEVDTLLQKLLSIPNWTSNSVINVKSTNAAPGLASTAPGGYIDQLLANGVGSVITT